MIFIDAVATVSPGTIRTYTRDEITSVPTGIRVRPHEPTINDAIIVLESPAPHRGRSCWWG